MSKLKNTLIALAVAGPLALGGGVAIAGPAAAHTGTWTNYCATSDHTHAGHFKLYYVGTYIIGGYGERHYLLYKYTSFGQYKYHSRIQNRCFRDH